MRGFICVFLLISAHVLLGQKVTGKVKLTAIQPSFTILEKTEEISSFIVSVFMEGQGLENAKILSLQITKVEDQTNEFMSMQVPIIFERNHYSLKIDENTYFPFNVDEKYFEFPLTLNGESRFIPKQLSIQLTDDNGDASDEVTSIFH